MTLSRRQFGSLTAAATLGLAAPAVRAQAREVVFAMASPLSGPWARLGELSVLGARFAVDEINNAGGIRALGGARVRLATVDVGDSPEKAKTAAERLLAQEPQLVGGAGAYVSSFTLAVTEVTERAGVPWLTLSYSDLITSRGFRHVYQTSPTADDQAANALPTIIELAKAATGRAPQTMGIVMDNTASPVSFTRGLRAGGAERLGVRIVVDETFTPPLSDAGPVMQRVRAARPDILLLLPTAIPDIKLTLEKLNEIGLGRGRLPIINNGGPMGSPDLLRLLGPNLLEGAMFITATWGMKGQEDLIARFREKTGEPWITQDSLSNYGHMMILREAVERAGTTEREKVNDAIRALDLTEGPAAGAYPGHRVRFDERGRRVGAPLVIAQWQNGVPVTVYPNDAAMAQPIWPRR
ncbi:ABC transporter substrate-binding protein [Falsiroseomonas sp. HW251]|uniref:ABC transporter substrate-binding protein n=1 Tax=Falsiroseomonas sp. HW251 TaxID=3390998 RepID=UPI003D3228D9